MKSLFLASTTLLFTLFALAHGEDKYGPNGGFVRMPGAFHAEVVVDGTHKLKVYLLDIQWKNPSILKSSVKINYKGKSKAMAECAAVENYFSCSFPATVDLTKKGELKLMAEREEQKGMEVTYKLPLKLEIPAATQHSEHH